MHRLATTYEIVKPKTTDVCFYMDACWGGGTPSPAFTVGGFMPPDRYRKALVIPTSFEFPKTAGYIEDKGRNQYINDCSASLLVLPPKKGNPCINHLHLIPDVVQDEHTHPSDRIGLVVRGKVKVVCETWPMGEMVAEGDAWYLPAGEKHHFETGDEVCDIMVYHPDSEWGPTNESHQMLDATILSDRNT